MPLHGRYYVVLFCLFAFTNSFGKAAENRLDVPLAGNFGCKFNKDLCSSQEVCIDDDLFGNCQSKRSGNYDLRSYDLDLDTLEQLEKFLRDLIDRKYSWRSLYTQCMVAGTLFAFRNDVNFNPKDCKEAFDHNSGDKIDDEVLEFIQSYYDDLDDDNSPSLDRNRDESMNRNYATVHRYYEPTKKKNSFYLPLDSQALSSKDEKSQDYYQFLKSLSPEELKILEEYVFGESGRDLNSEVERSEENKAQTNNQKTTNDDSQEPPIKKSDQVLTSVEAQVLLKLLNGDLDVNVLTDDEVKRMSDYVSRLLGDDNQRKNQQSVSSEMATVLPSVGADQKYSEQMMDGWANRDPVGVIEVDKSQESAATPKWATPSVMEITKEQSNDALLSNYAAQKKEVASVGEKSATVVVEPSTEKPKSKYALVENDYVYITFSGRLDSSKAMSVVQGLEALLNLNQGDFNSPRLENNSVIFHVSPDNKRSLNASQVAALAYQYHGELEKLAELSFVEAGIGNVHKLLVESKDSSPPRYFILTFVLCGCVAGVLIIVVALYLVRRHSRTKQKLAQLAGTADPKEASQDYQDLCRQRMQTKAQEKPEPLHIASRIGSSSEVAQSPRSSKSSTSSWSEEPVTTNMDISTGHVVLSYMEDHLKDRDRLEREWDALCAYEAEPSSTEVASKTNNARKNRYTDVLPYDHSRVMLNPATNVSSSDYVNASSITDHDPRNPAYIATQAPLPHTVADFWQMVWEQGSVVIVMLTSLTENGMAMCHRYWPEEGSDLYHIYEVHLVSEHIWCDDFLVRSFYLKNLQTNETRTVTQFHYLTWPEGGIPSSAKSLLDFRRKVNKSYRGRSCPVIVHCNDGVGRTGTYILIDMVLNRMYKGAKEIDIAATLEHIRDQRISMLQTKDQFEFSLAAVAEEVHAILKALPQ